MERPIMLIPNKTIFGKVIAINKISWTLNVLNLNEPTVGVVYNENSDFFVDLRDTYMPLLDSKLGELIIELEGIKVIR